MFTILLIFIVNFVHLEVRMDTRIAHKTWEMSNSMEVVGSVDEIYRYDKQQQQDILSAKPWEKEYAHTTLSLQPS